MYKECRCIVCNKLLFQFKGNSKLVVKIVCPRCKILNDYKIYE